MKPLISIGMPVFNEEAYIEESILSLLNQEYDHFELIICDNSSTDQTGEICLKLAKEHKRSVSDIITILLLDWAGEAEKTENSKPSGTLGALPYEDLNTIPSQME